VEYVDTVEPGPDTHMELTEIPRESIEAVEGVHRYNLRHDRAYGHKDGDWRWRGLYANGRRTHLRTPFFYKLSLKRGLAKYPLAARMSAVGELGGLHVKHTWVPVHLRDQPVALRGTLIRSSLFFKEKYLSTGDFEKLKARLVAGGNMQDRSLYSDEEINSPTVHLSSVYLVAATAARERRTVKTMDVPSAFVS
jgi:hypothetical protein